MYFTKKNTPKNPGVSFSEKGKTELCISFRRWFSSQGQIYRVVAYMDMQSTLGDFDTCVTVRYLNSKSSTIATL